MTDGEGGGDGGDGGGGSGLRDKLTDWRDELVKLLVVGLPTLLVQQGYGWVADRFFDQPWQALWFVVPLAGAGWIAWRVVVRRQREMLLRGPLLVFLALYVAAFAVAAHSDLLDWRRDLVGPGEKAPASWLLPARFGDWRYWLAPREPSAKELVVVTTPREDDLVTGRHQILSLLAIAARHQARGIALDFYLREETTPVDRGLCEVVARADMPVVFGYLMEEKRTGGWGPALQAPTLDECLDGSQRGHAMLLADLDGMVRLVPLSFGRRRRPALSLRVAALLQGVETEELDVPGDDYLQPLAPRDGHLALSFEEIEAMSDRELATELGGLFLLVGEDSDRETFTTPRGDRLGVELHADAVHALRTGAHLRRVPPVLTFGVLLVVCYLLTALAAAGAAAGRLARVAGWVSVAVAAVSALAAWAARLWVDVVYTLVAVWLLLALLLLLRRLPRFAPESEPGSASSSD